MSDTKYLTYVIMYNTQDADKYEVPSELREFFSQFPAVDYPYVSQVAHTFHVTAPQNLCEKLRAMDLVAKLTVKSEPNKTVRLSKA